MVSLKSKAKADHIVTEGSDHTTIWLKIGHDRIHLTSSARSAG